MMEVDHFRYLISHPLNRVECRHRILEYHGDMVAPDSSHITFADFEEICAVIKYLAARDPCRHIRKDTQYRFRDRRLPCPCFPDQSQCLSAFQFQRHSVHCMYDFAVARVLDSEIPDIKEVFSFLICFLHIHNLLSLSVSDP